MRAYKHKDALKRSIVILAILILSVVIGFVYQSVGDSLDRRKYPCEYGEFVEKYSVEYGVPEYVVYSCIKTESSFDPGAQSSKGARGLMQIMPDTFTWLCTLTKENYETGMLFDPETNIKYGTYYLSYLYLRYNDWETVYAAYNAGPGAVDGWLSDPECAKDGKLTDIPYKETSRYVKKMTKAVEMYQKLYYSK